jgi:hypothetical protein
VQLLQVAARLFLVSFEKSNAESNFSSLQIRHFLLMGIGFVPSLNLDINNKSNLIVDANHHSSTSNTHYIRTLNSIPSSKSTNDNLRITNSINNPKLIVELIPLTCANRYAIKSLSFDKIEIGKVNAIPLITFHVALTNNHPYYTNAGMFDKFLKYLHDTGFRVLTLKQIGYDANIFFIKNVHQTRMVSITNDTATSSNIPNAIHKTPFM